MPGPWDDYKEPAKATESAPWEDFGGKAETAPAEPKGFFGKLKDKVMEAEEARKKAPIKTALVNALNTPLMLSMPGSLARTFGAPDEATKYLPDPTGASLVKGAVDMPIKVAQIGQHAYDWATGGTGQNLAADQLANRVDALYQDPTVVQSRMGEMAGQSLLPLGLGNLSKGGQAVKQANLMWKALKGGAAGAGMAVTATPDVGVRSNEDFSKRQVLPATVGAVAGGVIPPVVEGAAGLLTRKLTPEAQAIADLGDRFGVRTLAPDLAANHPGLAKSAVLAESVPGSGMVNQRVLQQKEAKAAAEKLLAQHGIEGEIPATIQGSLEKNLASVKGRVRAAYDEVGKLAEGLGEVPLDKTLAEIQRLKAAEASAVVPDQGLVSLLEKMEQRLSLPEVDKTYTGVRGLRSDLGSMVADYYKGTNATTGSKGVQVLQGVKKAVEGDLAAFTEKAGGDVAEAARHADDLYSKPLVPLKDRVIVSATKNSEPDQIYKSIVAAGPGRALKFYKALTPDGQAAVRAQMVKDAFAAATKQDGVFSPAQFAKELEGIKDATGVFFKGQDKFELDGLTNLMRHIQRAGQVNENPPTGQRVLIGLLTGEAAHGVGAALGHGPEALAAAVGTGAATVGGARALTKLFSSKAGKALLLGAADTAPGSPAMGRLIEKDLPRILGQQSAPSNVTPFQPAPAKVASNNE